MKKTNLLTLTECSIMIALSTVLSVIPLFEMPYGGSITLASFLPIVIIAYRHGIKYGTLSAGVASILQMLLGLKNFSFFTTWQSILALALFDYVLAFTVFGFAGALRKRIKQQNLSMVAGATLASISRYLCHVISGATIWAGLSIPTEAALVYSLGYNATYMIPETVILVLSSAYIGSVLDFRAKKPTRIKNESLDKVSSVCLISAGLATLITLITDTVLVFSKLQDADSGELNLAALSSVNWWAVLTVTMVGALISATLVIYTKIRLKQKT